jgi:uncharacterized membrane protein
VEADGWLHIGACTSVLAGLVHGKCYWCTMRVPIQNGCSSFDGSYIQQQYSVMMAIIDQLRPSCHSA